MPVYVSRLSQWIEKRFNAKGGNVITDIDTSGRLNIPWMVGVEDRYLQGWNRYWGTGNAANVAAQFSAVRLRNPTGSNVIAVVERINVFEAVADTPFLNIQAVQTDFANTISATRLDSRTGATSGAMAFTAGAAAAQTGQRGFQAAIAAAGVPYDFILNQDQQLTLLPGDTLTVWSNTVNTPMNSSWVWRERGLELSELT